MQVLEDAEARVEADEIDQLERAHRVVQPELQRLVDVARRGDPFHQHVERLVADAGVDAGGDEAGRLAHEHGLLPHLPRDLLDRLRASSGALSSACTISISFILWTGIEEVHARPRATGCFSDAGHLGDAERRRVGRDDRGRPARSRSISANSASLRSIRSGAASMTKSAPSSASARLDGRRQPPPHGVGVARLHLAELDALADDRLDRGAPLRRATASDTSNIRVS